MLEIKSVYKKFGETEALKGVSFQIKKGEVVGLLGPNGAGKTTLMRILVGYYGKYSGKIVWEGEEVDAKEISHRERVGYLAEGNSLDELLTVKEYLNFIGEIKGLWGKQLEESRIRVVKECGLTEYTGKRIEKLSKGYKQRVGIAAALIAKNELLILDEPSSGLDPKQIIEIRKLIKKVAKDRMVLLSTHILSEAREVCDRIVIISRGKVVFNEKTGKVKNIEKKFVELTE